MMSALANRNFGVGTRLLASFAVVAFLAVLAIASGLVGYWYIGTQFQVVAEKRVPEIANSGNAAELASGLLTWTARTAAVRTPEALSESEAALAQVVSRLHGLDAAVESDAAGESVPSFAPDAVGANLSERVARFEASAADLLALKDAELELKTRSDAAVATLFELNAAAQREFQFLAQNAMSAITTGEARAIGTSRTAILGLSEQEVPKLLYLVDLRAEMAKLAALAAMNSGGSGDGALKEKLSKQIGHVRARLEAYAGDDATLKSRVSQALASIAIASPSPGNRVVGTFGSADSIVDAASHPCTHALSS
ncbi:MAG: hypothetical protein AAF479_11025 [Pseudomonadota bacterium]